MRTDKIYVASLRIAINRISTGFFQSGCINKHAEYVLVKTKDMETFKNIKTGEKYNYYFGKKDKAIDVSSITPFNEVVNNEKKHLSKRKALTLFEDKMNKQNKHSFI